MYKWMSCLAYQLLFAASEIFLLIMLWNKQEANKQVKLRMSMLFMIKYIYFTYSIDASHEEISSKFQQLHYDESTEFHKPLNILSCIIYSRL